MNLTTYLQPLTSLRANPVLLVFSHLRWHFVTQRPQHLLVRASETRDIIFWEEPVYDVSDTDHDELRRGPWLERLDVADNPAISVVRPHLRLGSNVNHLQRQMLDDFLDEGGIIAVDGWFYTPMALAFASHLSYEVVVYDAMDELSAFLGAPPELLLREQELFDIADVVFTGGHAIFEHKRGQHHNVHAHPSSVDLKHFAPLSAPVVEPQDQVTIPHPRVGFYGVLDERLDIDLIRRLSELRPELQIVLIGPVVKIDPATLPIASNIHYLGAKTYHELPAYLGAWDVALLPFAMNESTRFISPTKTPEYLAAGKRVVSTPIRDVVFDYGDKGLVEIAGSAQEFAKAIDRSLAAGADPVWTERVSRKLSQTSWDTTWAAMETEMQRVRPSESASHKLPASAEVCAYRRATAPSSHKYDFLIVGAGFSGAVLAERLATMSGKRVLLVDKRHHIGGNAYDEFNADGILVHPYGPHIFHTASQKVVDYLSQFTEWRPYEHRVLASVDHQLVPIPINLDTLEKLYGIELDAKGMEAFLAERVEERETIRTSEDIVVSKVGRELYEKFFKNYTKKQWGVDPSQLDSSVAGRIPVRFDRDDRYFSDAFQAMPLHGYTAMFERMLKNPKITIMLGTDYREIMNEYSFSKMVYTGPIDEFFDFRFGRLPYRSLQFKHDTHDQEQFQPVGVVNYPNEHSYTRITEFKHLTGQEHAKTSIVYEYPTAEGDPYYPVPRPENARLYEMYRELAEDTPDVYFCGRLANYKYFNMDQVVAQALHVYRNIVEEESVESGAVKATTMSALVSQPRVAGRIAN